jgi:hypothetical protein
MKSVWEIKNEQTRAGLFVALDWIFIIPSQPRGAALKERLPA